MINNTYNFGTSPTWFAPQQGSLQHNNFNFAPQNTWFANGFNNPSFQMPLHQTLMQQYAPTQGTINDVKGVMNDIGPILQMVFGGLLL